MSDLFCRYYWSIIPTARPELMIGRQRRRKGRSGTGTRHRQHSTSWITLILGLVADIQVIGMVSSSNFLDCAQLTV